MKSCLLCGVGGQGTVLASRILAAAAMEKDLFARTAETIGMAQRGGSVVSHVRIGETVTSPMIPYGTADVLVGFEPGEAVKNLAFLKKDGIVIVSDKTVAAVTQAVKGDRYQASDMIDALKKNSVACYVLGAEKIYEACGSRKVLNVALLGALAESGVMGLTMEEIERALVRKVKPQFVEMNKKALQLGAEAVRK